MEFKITMLIHSQHLFKKFMFFLCVRIFGHIEPGKFYHEITWPIEGRTVALSLAMTLH